MSHSPAGQRTTEGAEIWVRIDGQTLEIQAVEVASSEVRDGPMLLELLAQFPTDQDIANVTASGAHGTRKCQGAIAERGAASVIPPRRNAKPWKTATAGSRTQRGPAGVEIPQPCALAMMERLPPPERRRD
jgi:hypothetical protein